MSRPCNDSEITVFLNNSYTYTCKLQLCMNKLFLHMVNQSMTHSWLPAQSEIAHIYEKLSSSQTRFKLVPRLNRKSIANLSCLQDKDIWFFINKLWKCKFRLNPSDLDRSRDLWSTINWKVSIPWIVTVFRRNCSTLQSAIETFQLAVDQITGQGHGNNSKFSSPGIKIGKDILLWFLNWFLAKFCKFLNK